MPSLVRTIDEIFRAEKRDIYLIRFSKNDLLAFESSPPGQVELIEWFACHLPDTHIELVGPQEDSGWICGGIDGTLWVDFDEQGLAIFCAEWEDENGQSIDARFQCYFYPLTMYENLRRRKSEGNS